MLSNLLNILIKFESYLETQYLHHDTFMNYYSHASLCNILRRVRSAWSRKMSKTSPRFWKVLRFRARFLSIWGIRIKCVSVVTNKYHSTFDRVHIHRFLPADNGVLSRMPSVQKTKVSGQFPMTPRDDKGELRNLYSANISWHDEVRH